MIDLDAIKGRANSAYLLDRDDGDALFAAMGDVKALVAEVERLRSTVVALTEEIVEERAAVVAYLDDMMQDCFLIGRHREGHALAFYARRIERGEHRREEER